MNDKILKPGAAPGVAASSVVASKVVKGQTYGAGIEAAQILDAAHAQSRRILESATDERQTVIEAARQEGYEHGLRQWNAAIADVNAARERYLAESEPELIRLAVRIAQKIIGEELRTNPEAIV